MSPTDYGWKWTQNCFRPDWYLGSLVPESLTSPPMDDGDSVGATSTDDESSDNAWSEASDKGDGEDV